MAAKRSATKNKAPEVCTIHFIRATKGRDAFLQPSRRQSTLHAHFTRRRRSPSLEKDPDIPASMVQDAMHPNPASEPPVTQDSDYNEDALLLLETRSDIPHDAESSDGDFAELNTQSTTASDTDILAQYPASPLSSLPVSPQTSASSSPEIVLVNLRE